MAARYNHDYIAFRKHVLLSSWLGANMLGRAERVMVFAEAHAPFDPDDPDGEHYKDAFDVELVRDTERVRGRVTNSDQAALKVEYGTKNNPRHRTLGSALEAAK